MNRRQFIKAISSLVMLPFVKWPNDIPQDQAVAPIVHIGVAPIRDFAVDTQWSINTYFVESNNDEATWRQIDPATLYPIELQNKADKRKITR